MLHIMAFCGRSCASVFPDNVCRIFRIAPGFLGGTFNLLRGAFIGQFLIADCFSDALLDFSCYLVKLPFDFFGVHIHSLVRLVGAAEQKGC
jgi:hypothetical protein